MNGEQLAAIIGTLLGGSELPVSEFERFYSGQVHWRAAWRDGVVELRAKGWRYRSDMTSGPRLRVWWRSPVPGESVNVTLLIDQPTTRARRVIKLYRLSEGPQWRYWGRTPIDGGRWVEGGPSWAEGYWATTDPLPEYRPRISRNLDLSGLPPGGLLRLPVGDGGARRSSRSTIGDRLPWRGA